MLFVVVLFLVSCSFCDPRRFVIVLVAIFIYDHKYIHTRILNISDIDSDPAYLGESAHVEKVFMQCLYPEQSHLKSYATRDVPFAITNPIFE